MGPGGSSPIVGGLPPCLFCHAPHSGVSGATTLWSQKLSPTQNYTLYSKGSITNVMQQPVLGKASNLCLSCHDGTVAPGQTTPWGKIKMSGSMSSTDIFGQNLSNVHPFNFKLPLQMPTKQDLLSSVVSPGVTANPAVRLISRNVQCVSCHNPHVQSIDSSNAFLVIENTGSPLCLACHVSTPQSSNMKTVKSASLMVRSQTLQGASSTQSSSNQSTYNGLTGWSNSAHAQSGNQASKTANVGSHGTVRNNGCLSCHTTHNAQAGSALLSPPKQSLPNVDASTQNCLNCHNGGSTVSPAIPNIYQEFNKKGHPFPSGSNSHSTTESTMLNKNRHATCVDCHDPHSAQKTSSFVSVTLRPAQNGASGVSAVDGVTVISPAVNQYEICLRCHGTSTGKQTLATYGYFPARVLAPGGDPLNVVSQLSTASVSSHPVAHDRRSQFSQPSLLKYMWNLDGHTQGRLMGSRLLCTDCHNSDDNREFGGQGPNGPHGSQYSHILERQYEFSQVVPGVPPMGGPGTAIQNLLPMVVAPGANGPYALCAKCHDLSNILSNASFSKHSIHINAGFSCSVCHTAHGVANASVGLQGVRLVDFDVNVVARNDATQAPISYNRSAGTCSLKCHNYNHNQDGTVTSSQVNSTIRTKKH